MKYLNKSFSVGIHNPRWDEIFKKEGKMKHTKGPWEIEDDKQALASYVMTTEQIKEESGYIAQCSYTCGLEIDEAKANAKLIAAAPTMYEALKLAKQFIENGIELGYIVLPGKGDSGLDTLPAIKQAIAKAQGE